MDQYSGGALAVSYIYSDNAPFVLTHCKHFVKCMGSVCCLVLGEDVLGVAYTVGVVLLGETIRATLGSKPTALRVSILPLSSSLIKSRFDSGSRAFSFCETSAGCGSISA